MNRAPKPNPWPFIIADLFLLALAAWIVSTAPAGIWPVFIAFLAVATGAWISVTPFIMGHRAELKFAEAGQLADTVSQIRNVQDVGDAIQNATAQWQSVQDQSSRTVKSAKEIADRMTAETKEFFSFLENADQTEKNHLKLEIEKLRRAEGDWLGILIHIFDHIYGLNLAAARSRHPEVAAQIGQFQTACREIARRVGLVAFVPLPDEPFNQDLHQLPHADSSPPPDAAVDETLATGYTFQGQLVRKAVVSLKSPAPDALPASPAPAQEQLSL
jgi:molecular chaperone GrpE (heat shock protein)